MKINNEKLRSYRAEGFSSVDGWCSEELFKTVDLIASSDLNKTGGCLEIGVHHGKLFILLNAVISPREKSFALDIFENQDQNIDGSGKGDIETFMHNLRKFDAHKGKNVEIIMGDSSDPSLHLEKKIGLGSMRFISIDGGHTVEHTVNDLYIASRLINNQGVVILDDVLNHHWLGVIEGVGKYLSTAPTLVPFAVGHNKLYFIKNYLPRKVLTVI